MLSHFLGYCRMVFSFAVRHAISRAQFTIAVISFITGVAIWLAPAFGMTIDASGLKAEETIAQLEQRCAILDAGEPYSVSVSDFVSWRIKVHNAGASATNVKMDLCNITPRPKSQFLDRDFPYHIVQAGFTMDSNECHIHRGGDAIFELTRVWPAAHNSGFLTTLNTRLAHTNQVLIEPGEQWEKMEYMVTADNAEALIFTLRMQIRSGEVTFERRSN